LKSHESGTEGEDETRANLNDIFGNNKDQRAREWSERIRENVSSRFEN